jgi:hypothetical protein
MNLPVKRCPTCSGYGHYHVGWGYVSCDDCGKTGYLAPCEDCQMKEALEQHVLELEKELEQWRSYSHPWVTSQGDPEGLTPERVRELTNKALDEKEELESELGELEEHQEQHQCSDDCQLAYLSQIEN